LCLGGGALSVAYLIRSVFGAVGRPEIAARGVYLFLIVLAIPMYPAIHRWGILGAAGSYGVASFASLAYLLWAAGRMVGCGLAASLKVLAAPALGAAGMCLGVASLRAWTAGGDEVWLLALQVLTGAALYPTLAAALDWMLGSGLLRALRVTLRLS